MPIGGCQEKGDGDREKDEGDQSIQNSSNKINKSWGCSVQHGDYD